MNIWIIQIVFAWNWSHQDGRKLQKRRFKKQIINLINQINLKSWRHFSQCKLPKPHSTAHLKTLFNRSGKYIQELIFAPNSPDGKLNQYSVGRLSDWIHLMPKLHTICIVDRQLAHREKSVNGLVFIRWTDLRQ